MFINSLDRRYVYIITKTTVKNLTYESDFLIYAVYLFILNIGYKLITRRGELFINLHKPFNMFLSKLQHFAFCLRIRFRSNGMALHKNERYNNQVVF